MATFLLYESASGYALFEAKDMDWIGDTPQAVAETVKCVLSVLFFFKSPPLSPGFDWEKRRKTRPPKFSRAREGKFCISLLSLRFLAHVLLTTTMYLKFLFTHKQ